MDDQLKKILSGSNNHSGEEKLFDYLNNNLTETERHELEMQMNDDEFMSDAMDGLQEINDATQLPGMVKQLNAGLKNKLGKNNKKRRRKYFSEGSYIYFSIVILLLLAVVAFVVIRKFLAA